MLRGFHTAPHTLCRGQFLSAKLSKKAAGSAPSVTTARLWASADLTANSRFLKSLPHSSSTFRRISLGVQEAGSGQPKGRPSKSNKPPTTSRADISK